LDNIVNPPIHRGEHCPTLHFGVIAQNFAAAKKNEMLIYTSLGNLRPYFFCLISQSRGRNAVDF